MEETENKHAMGGIIWSGFNTFILTQAGRRAIHFVKLVSSQVKKTEKWSGLAIKQLTSYHVPPPEQMKNEASAGKTPVPIPWPTTSPSHYLLCGIEQGMHEISSGNMLLAVFKVTQWEGAVFIKLNHYKWQTLTMFELSFSIFFTCSRDHDIFL